MPKKLEKLPMMVWAVWIDAEDTRTIHINN